MSGLVVPGLAVSGLVDVADAVVVVLAERAAWSSVAADEHAAPTSANATMVAVSRRRTMGVKPSGCRRDSVSGRRRPSV